MRHVGKLLHTVLLQYCSGQSFSRPGVNNPSCQTQGRGEQEEQEEQEELEEQEEQQGRGGEQEEQEEQWQEA